MDGGVKIDAGPETMRSIAATLLLSLAMPGLSFAQDAGPGTAGQEERAAEIDELEPGVDTSAAPSGDAPEEPAAEATIAADVTREQSGGRVMDRMELGRTEITGNQELPKVLYIVPWQKAEPGELIGRPVNTLLDEVLAPIDREEFVRQVDYYDDLYGEDGGE